MRRIYLLYFIFGLFSFGLITSCSDNEKNDNYIFNLSSWTVSTGGIEETLKANKDIIQLYIYTLNNQEKEYIKVKYKYDGIFPFVFQGEWFVITAINKKELNFKILTNTTQLDRSVYISALYPVDNISQTVEIKQLGKVPVYN